MSRRAARFLSLADAVAEHVRDGDQLALEGFTHLVPFAAAHEIMSQGRQELALVRMTPDVVYDQLIGLGCARQQRRDRTELARPARQEASKSSGRQRPFER